MESVNLFLPLCNLIQNFTPCYKGYYVLSCHSVVCIMLWYFVVFVALDFAVIFVFLFVVVRIKTRWGIIDFCSDFSAGELIPVRFQLDSNDLRDHSFSMHFHCSDHDCSIAILYFLTRIMCILSMFWNKIVVIKQLVLAFQRESETILLQNIYYYKKHTTKYRSIQITYGPKSSKCIKPNLAK